MDHKARCQQALDLVTRYGTSTAAAAISGENPRTLRERAQKARDYYKLEAQTKGPDDQLSRALVEIEALKERLAHAQRPRFSIRTDTPTHEKIRICCIGDAHDTPGLSKERFRWIGEHINATRPDVVVQIGDFATVDSLNSHEGNETLKGRAKPSFGDDMKSFLEALETLNEPIKYTPEKHCTLGNHERRIWNYENKNPEMDGQLSMDLMGKLEKTGWTASPYPALQMYGGVGFNHAAINSMGKTCGGKNAEATISNEAVCDLVIGHSHRHRSWSAAKISPTNRSVKIYNVGCALPHGHIEDYAKHTLTGWHWGVADFLIRDGHIADDSFTSMLTLEERYG